jgi:hypothetical protein
MMERIIIAAMETTTLYCESWLVWSLGGRGGDGGVDGPAPGVEGRDDGFHGDESTLESG